MTTSKRVRADHSEFLFPCVANFYEQPVVITRAEGSRVFDPEGVEYLDFFGGILTVSLAHCHPEIADAIAKQVRTLGHTSTLYPTENMIEAAKTLAKLSPGKLKKTFFTNSGSEADETAVMLAKVHTGQQEIIALRHGYHGRTHFNTALTAHKSYRLLPTQVAGVVHAPAPYCYRCPFGLSYPSCDVKCARDIEELIQTTTNGKPAALLAEPILGVGGFITPPKEYFEIAVGIVRNYGGLFICDEVQTGFGRTGDKWFGIEHYGVEPDIMTMAKGIANGMPVAATITTDEIAGSWKAATISTFGGNPVSMAATNTTLAIMERDGVPKRAAELGAVVGEFLDDAVKRYEFVGEARGKGLMRAIELVEDKASKQPSPGKTNQLMEAAKKRGLLIGKGGLYGNTIRLAPPMLISRDELSDALTRLDQALSDIA